MEKIVLVNRAFKSTPAVQVKPGDIVIFDEPRWDVVIEQVAPMNTDGWTILRANNDTWSLALKNTDTVRVLQVEKPLSYKLRGGEIVLAKISKYSSDPYPYTFANRTQAQKAAEKNGGEVIQRGRPFFVRVAA